MVIEIKSWVKDKDLRNPKDPLHGTNSVSAILLKEDLRDSPGVTPSFGIQDTDASGLTELKLTKASLDEEHE